MLWTCCGPDIFLWMQMHDHWLCLWEVSVHSFNRCSLSTRRLVDTEERHTHTQKCVMWCEREPSERWTQGSVWEQMTECLGRWSESPRDSDSGAESCFPSKQSETEKKLERPTQAKETAHATSQRDIRGPHPWVSLWFYMFDTQQHSDMWPKPLSPRILLFDTLELCRRSIWTLASLEDLWHKCSVFISHRYKEVRIYSSWLKGPQDIWILSGTYCRMCMPWVYPNIQYS